MRSLRRSQVTIPLTGALLTFLFLSALAFSTRALVHRLTYSDVDDELETLSTAVASRLEEAALPQPTSEVLHRGVQANVLAFHLEHHSVMLVDERRIIATTGDLARHASFPETVQLRQRAGRTFDALEPFTGQRRRCRFRVLALSGASRGQTVIVFRSVEPVLRMFRLLDLALLSIVAIGLLGSASILAFAVRRSLRPVEEVTRFAEHATASDLSRRIETIRGGEELQHLVVVMNELFDRLDRAFQAQRQLVADAAHELKTPVAIIAAEAQEAAREDTPEEVRNELLRSIVASARSLGRETDNLLLLARGDTARPSEEVDLMELAHDAASAFESELRRRELTLHVQAEGPTTLSGDDDALRRLLANLLANAIHYSHPGGDLEIALRGSDSSLELSVADRGDGVSAEDRERIFDRFVRLPSGRRMNPGGSGLGLAIAQQAVRRHHGIIRVDDRVGGGAVFVVTFPRNHAAMNVPVM